MTPKSVEQIADAILYEGYVLYPYRASSVKNSRRWNFGVLYPPSYAAAQQGSDASVMRCECLMKGTSLNVTVRFLQLVTRDTLDLDGNPIRTWQEAIARDIDVSIENIESTVRAPAVTRFSFPARDVREPARGQDGEDTGEIVRRQEPVEGIIEVSARRANDGWFRACVQIFNCGAFDNPRMHSVEWGAREAALRRSLVSTHAILQVPGGQFASLLEPPDELRQLTAECVNVGVWPVLAGETTPSETILASPIILYDYPKIAPESAGALFDGTEIDEILSLRILALTEEEKREMGDTDPRARRILERTEALAPEQWLQLHGTMREKRPTETAP